MQTCAVGSQLRKGADPASVIRRPAAKLSGPLGRFPDSPPLPASAVRLAKGAPAAALGAHLQADVTEHHQQGSTLEDPHPGQQDSPDTPDRALHPPIAAALPEGASPSDFARGARGVVGLASRRRCSSFRPVPETAADGCHGFRCSWGRVHGVVFSGELMGGGLPRRRWLRPRGKWVRRVVKD